MYNSAIVRDKRGKASLDEQNVSQSSRPAPCRSLELKLFQFTQRQGEPFVRVSFFDPHQPGVKLRLEAYIDPRHEGVGIWWFSQPFDPKDTVSRCWAAFTTFEAIGGFKKFASPPWDD